MNEVIERRRMNPCFVSGAPSTRRATTGQQPSIEMSVPCDAKSSVQSRDDGGRGGEGKT